MMRRMTTVIDRTRVSDGPASSRSAVTWAVPRGVERAVIVLALAVRLLVFPFAENKHADAPIRAMIAERMNGDPIAGADPRSFCQFGPLPIEVMRPFIAVDSDARRSSRLPSLLAGLAVFLPFFALGRRLLGTGTADHPALLLAGLALAVSPLHVQVSTTAASEAIYLFVLLAAFERLHAAVSDNRRRDYVYAGAWASLAAVTRYDTWVALPVAVAAALVFGRRDRRTLVNLALFAGVAALLPLGYLAWSGAKSGDPFFFARYITQDHQSMAAAVRARMGAGLARARQVGIWAVSFAAAMTPVAFLALGIAARQWRRWSAGTRVVLAMAMAPPAAYLAKGLLFGDFEPLPRFAIAPGAVLLPLAAAALISTRDGKPVPRRLNRAAAAVIAGAVALSALALGLAFGRPGRIWAGAESIGPLTRLDTEDRQLARYLLAHRAPTEGVFIDTLGYLDIAIAHAARVPAPLTATLAHTRTPGPTLGVSRASTGASWFAVHDDSWGRTTPPDWPAWGTVRLGRWRLVHLGDAGRAVDVR